MKLNKLWDGLKRVANGDYVLEGNLISDETIEVDLDDRLVVHGSVISKKSIIVHCGIKAGCGIEAGDGIKAGWGIEAGWGIKAGDGIEAGWGIEAGSFIHSEKRIFAGISLCHTTQNCKKTIRCAELRKGEICYGELLITKPEPKTFKVVCVGYNQEHEPYFTIGKIYTWENNTLTNDNGFTYEGGTNTGANVAGDDPDKWGLSNWYKFIKIVEE